jgi:DNA-binding LytR/AlgR family response regulator
VKSIRAVIVDDEPLTRERVRDLATRSEGITVVAEGSNGLQALDLIAFHKPDLIFIDVEMPELNGFGVISELNDDLVPAIIFITAYEHYAKKGVRRRRCGLPAQAHHSIALCLRGGKGERKAGSALDR